MPFPFALVIPPAFEAFSRIFGGNQQANAANKAARIQADATRYATDAATRANAEALKYTREQADRDFAMAETNRHANYDQWASRERRIGSLGALVGLPAREIPGYVPFNGSSGGSPGGELDPKAQAIINQAMAELPPTAGSMNEIVKRLNAAGYQTTVPTRATGALSSDKFTVNGQMFDSIFDVDGPNAKWQFNPVGGDAPASKPAYQPGTLGSYALSAPQDPSTPALAMPMPQPGSLADYLNRRRYV